MNTFETLEVEIDGRIAWVTFDHPPINLLDNDVCDVSCDTAAGVCADAQSASFMSAL